MKLKRSWTQTIPIAVIALLLLAVLVTQQAPPESIVAKPLKKPTPTLSPGEPWQPGRSAITIPSPHYIRSQPLGPEDRERIIRERLAEEWKYRVRLNEGPQVSLVTSQANGAIVFAGTDGNLWVMDPNGSNQRQLTPGFSDVGGATWSPNGDRIVFGAEGSNGYVISADGTGLTQVISGFEEAFFFHWSPDGTRILFTGAEPGDVRGTYIVNADGTGLTRLAPGLGEHSWGASWSHDGQWIALAARRAEGGWGIYKLELASGQGNWLPGEFTCSTSVCTCGNQPYTYFAEWSPDGAKIAFVGLRAEEYKCGVNTCCRILGGLYLVDASGGADPQLIGDLTSTDYPLGASFMNLTWASDAARLATQASWEDGTWRTLIASASQGVTALSGQAGEAGGGMAWSPDASQLVTVLEQSGTDNVYVVDPVADSWGTPIAQGMWPDWGTPPPTPTVDLTIYHIEVVQAVQTQTIPISNEIPTITDTIPLVAGKPALVRVWISLGGTDPPASVCCAGGELEVEKDGVIWHLDPENPGDHIEVHSGWDRNNLNHSLNFKLPQETLQGNVRLTVRINQDQAVPEADYSNSELTTNKVFSETRSLHIVWVPVEYYGTQPDTQLAWQASAFIRKLYPIAYYRGLRYTRSPHVMYWRFCRIWNVAGECAAELVRELMLWQELYPDNAILYGWLPSSLFYGGRAEHGLSYLPDWAPAAWGSTEPGFTGHYLAHEIGHTMALCHTEEDPQSAENRDCLGTGTEPPYNQPPRNRRRVPPERTGVPGVDVLEYEIRGGWNYSMMRKRAQNEKNADATRWISPLSYQRLLEMLQPQATATILQSPEPAFLVSGIIGANDSARVSPALVIETQPDPADNDPTKPYRLELLDADGQIQLTHHFSVGFPSGWEYEAFVFAFALSGIGDSPANIRLWKEGQLLAERTAGAEPPSITLGAPNGGETWGSDAEQTVTWMASDPDGDPLTYALFYSPDDGATWRPLMMTITDTQYIIDPSYVPGSDQARIRVLATDGIHTSVDESDGTFTIETKAPQVGIATPTDGATIPLGATIDLTGWGYDPEDGDFPETGLTWHGPDNEVLGQGAWVQIRPTWAPGRYTLSLEVTDSEGRSAADTVTIFYGIYNVYLPVILR